MGDYWKQLHHRFPPSHEERALSLRLFQEYSRLGYLRRLNRELLETPLPVIVDFFQRSTALHSGRSPVSRKHDSRWMCESDYCFFNIRGAGQGRRPGDLVRAAFLLTGLRVDAVHLAPLTRAAGENLNALMSHSQVNRDLLCPELGEDFTAEDQLYGFVEAAHSLGIKVGFDLPLTLSRDGEVLYHRPEMFRWIKLDSRRGFDRESGLPFAREISREVQEDYARRIKEIVQKHLDRGIPYAKMGAYVREEGFFPVPVNAQRGKGVPYFITYDRDEQKPLFSQSSQESEMTTFQFTFPGDDFREEQKEAADYFSRIFPLWQNKFRIDFIYTDSLAPAWEDSELPGETPTPGQISRQVSLGKGTKRFAGAMTSGLPARSDQIAESGFNLIIDRSNVMRQDREYMNRQLYLYDLLAEINQAKRQTFSVVYHLGYAERNSLSCQQRLRRNHFLSRFLNCGMSRRSKYEAMGLNDGSSGFTTSLRERKNLEWSENRESLDFYHNLEDIYEREKVLLNKGKILHYHLDDRVFWWVIGAGKKLLIPVISVENEDMLPPGEQEINLSPFLKTSKAPTVMEYDFQSPSGNLVLFMGGHLPVERIPYRNFRLYSIS
ncbi:MAG: hypothetical protein PQJ59_18475 [Spirochaetales bacterium]|nr:hypothetical protein [Spirochaetales bacterium]